ncbi:MAG: chloride channel protein [Lentisphaeria bacterium]|nr:chloride channel protein [Lentisphaeria bacterium]
MQFLKNIAKGSLYGTAALLRGYMGDKAYILLLSVIVGVLAGLAAVLLKGTTDLFHHIADLVSGRTGEWIRPILPVAGIFLCVILVKLFLRNGKYEKSLSGVIVETSKGTSNIKGYHCWSHIITSGMCVGLGGSAGLEAPIALTGSAIGSNFSKLVRTGTETRTLLLACGGAAGISAIFNSPVAGALFACEILLPSFSVPALVPLLMASASAAVVSEILYGKFPFVESSNDWNMMNLPFYVVLGVLAGLISAYTIKFAVKTGKIFQKYENVWLKALCGSLILAGMLTIFPALRGEGYGFIGALVDRNESLLMSGSPLGGLVNGSWLFLGACFLLILLKVFSSATTIESGGDGGIFAPSMFIGAFTGFCVARFFNLLFPLVGIDYQLNEVNFLAVGMGAVIAGVMHAPMTGMFLIAEMTGGYKLFIPLMIAVSLSSFISKRIMKYNVYKSAIALSGGSPEPKQSAVIMEKVSLRNLVENNFHPVVATDTLRTLLKKVMESKRNLFPVLDENGGIIGIVTLDDVRPFLLDANLYDVVLVYDIMKPAGPSLEVNDSLGAATRLFESTKLWLIPVMEKGKYIGFVSKAGVFDKYRDMLRNQRELF